MHYVVWSALTYGVIVLVEAEIKKTTENEEGKDVGSYIANGIANAMNALTCCTAAADSATSTDEVKVDVGDETPQKRIAAVALLYPPGTEDAFGGYNMVLKVARFHGHLAHIDQHNPFAASDKAMRRRLAVMGTSMEKNKKIVLKQIKKETKAINCQLRKEGDKVGIPGHSWYIIYLTFSILQLQRLTNTFCE